MHKKILILTIIALALAVLLVACNDSTPDFTDYGYSVSGKITLHDLPEGISAEVSVLVNDEEVCTTSENGTFSLIKLSKGDEVTFYKDNVIFYPEKHRVTGNVYDLRIDGYYKADNDNNGSGDNNDTDTNPDNDVDNGDNGDNDGDNNSDNGGENTGNNNGNVDGPEIIYNCINAGLLFENNRVNFVFCVKPNFSKIDVIWCVDDDYTIIEVDETMVVGTVFVGETEYVQYSVDVSQYTTQECCFMVSAYNDNNVQGSMAKAFFTPVGVCTPTQITLDETTLTIENLDQGAVHFLLVNGVSVGEINSNTFDLAHLLAYNNTEVTISVLTYKAGYIPAISNAITTTLNIFDI